MTTTAFSRRHIEAAILDTMSEENLPIEDAVTEAIRIAGMEMPRYGVSAAERAAILNDYQIVGDTLIETLAA